MTKVMKKALALVLALTMVFSTVIVSNAAAKKTTVKINGVTATKTIYVQAGSKVTLTANAKVKVAKTSKKAVAKVKKSKKNVVVTAGKKAGTAKVTVTAYKCKKATVTVKVVSKKNFNKNYAVKAAKAKASVYAGDKTTVKMTLGKKVKAANLKITSSNKKVATVSSKLSKSKKVTITGVANGTATITVLNKKNPAVKATIKVTVNQKTVAIVDGKAVVPANINELSLQDANGKTVATLSKEELGELTAVGQSGKIATKLAEKAKTAGDKVSIAGKTATVKTAATFDATAGTATAVLTYAGKDYKVTATDKGTATVGGVNVSVAYDATTGYTITTDSKKVANYKLAYK